MSFKKQFGFLKNPIHGKLSGFELSVLPRHAEISAHFVQYSNQDGFFYPPQITLHKLDPTTLEKTKKIDRSIRPAGVFPVPASHEISITNPVNSTDPAFSDAALIMHSLAYLYGTRLQFSDWRIEGRIPNKSTSFLHINDDVCMSFLEHVYHWWRPLGNKERTSFINILFMLTRARSLEWEWDAFIYQYMVFDALYKLHITLKPTSSKGITHKQRLLLMLNEHGLPNNPSLLDSIYNTRNDLFHEATWTGASIYCQRTSDAYYLPSHLGRINSRIICGMVGYSNNYSKSPWWSIATSFFDKR